MARKLRRIVLRSGPRRAAKISVRRFRKRVARRKRGR